MRGNEPGERAVSPVIGVVLMTAIVVALGVVSGGILLGLSEEPDPAPGVTMSLEAEGPAALHALVHETGDRLDGDQLTLRGAADPSALAGTELAAGERRRVVPIDTELALVWTGEDDTAHVIWEATVAESDTVPESDHACPWVDSESNGGVDAVKINGDVVDCDVVTAENIEVNQGGIVIGETDSEAKDIDADDATFYGDIATETNINAQDSMVVGDATSADLAKIDNTTVTGSVAGQDTVDVISGSSVGGDVTTGDALVKVLDSEVSGSVKSDGDVKLDGATIEGDVYVDEATNSFDCTDSTIDGEDCSAYTPKDPGDY